MRAQFPNRIPDNIIGVTFIERRLTPEEFSQKQYIEWIGFWKGFAVGIKKLLYGDKGLVEIVVQTYALFLILGSEPVQKKYDEFYDSTVQAVLFVDGPPHQLVTFGFPKDLPQQTKYIDFDEKFAFQMPIITSGVSGQWSV